MTQEEFRTGARFSVFGIPHDMQFNPDRGTLTVHEGKKTHEQYIDCEDGNTCFTLVLSVFGIRQTVVIAFAACEPKEI